MALTGLIEDFGLADVLQLIVQRGKAGVILLVNEADEIRAAIDEGRVVAVENAGRPMESELASRLARAGIITPAQLGLVLKRRAQADIPVAHILVEERCASPVLVRRFATAQAIDTLLEVFTWPAGKYAFMDGGSDGIPRTIDPIGMEYLLINGIRAIDEMQEIERVVPSLAEFVDVIRPLGSGDLDVEVEDEDPTSDLVPDYAADLGAPRKDELEGLLDMGSAPVVTLGEHEHLIFQLCEGSGSVRSILDRAPLCRFEAMRALANLVIAGHVRISP